MAHGKGCSCKKCKYDEYDSLFRPNAKVSCEASCDFDLAGENEELFACWAAEHTDAIGTEVDYWQHDNVRTTLDPLYNEPECRVWKGPFRIKVFAEWPDQSFEVREEGARVFWDAKVYIPRLTVEGADMEFGPAEGDVLLLWDLPFFDAYAQGTDFNIPKAKYYFDVVGVVETGHALDNADFTGFKLDIKRRTEFAPERRLFNET